MTSPLRTALLAWDYPPAKSGLAMAAREVAESLAARGHDVTVLALDRTDDEEAGGVRVLGAGRHMTGDLKALRERAGTGHLAAPIAFAEAVRASGPFDLVESTNWYAPGVCVPRLGLPLVTRCSTPVSGTAEPGDARAAFDLRAAAGLERAQARASAGFVSNTDHHGAAMATLYGVAPPGPLHAVIGLSLPPGAVTAAPPAPDGPPHRLLFVGRPTRRKGFDALLEAAGLLGAAYELRLVGIAQGEGELPRNCVALGKLSEDALRAELRAAHAVLAPSRYESFGLVYQEAIQAHRPLVACAEDPSARAFVGEAGTGVLSASCEGRALAAAVRSLLEDEDRMHAAREACAVAARRFTRKSLGAETEALYRRVLQGRKGVSSAASSDGRAPPFAIAP
ncbi:glycosyltransferase family 4 protein [Parvularcula dongshanensis]|uniref:Glycosyltransferase involved in cell wall biosynthesis n=1 Tax=Parvularcula dongshanensis TaxID=1173995 RepID=A0A840I0I5_9PROT|nr:glycosyltransferase family 4 protein [Parvularcula dongshanensis]MBB4658339.1 glycosyltransferase involved in cell wall biosynthesis [Parvularcula dongshanensis]